MLGNYSGNMDITLDAYVEESNRKKDFQNYIDSYLQSLLDATTLFGEYAFRKVSPNYKKERKNQVNKLLMTAICVLLAKHRDSYKEAIENKRDLTQELANLIQKDSTFFNSITWSTNAKANIEYVFKKIKEDLFDKNLKSDNNG